MSDNAAVAATTERRCTYVATSETELRWYDAPVGEPCASMKILARGLCARHYYRIRTLKVPAAKVKAKAKAASPALKVDSTYAAVILDLEAEIVALDVRRAKLVAAIDAIRGLAENRV